MRARTNRAWSTAWASSCPAAHRLDRARGVLRVLEGCGVGGLRFGDRVVRPFVEHGAVVGRLHEALVLVLAAQVDRSAHRGGELFDAGDRTVDAHAAAAVGAHRAFRHAAFRLLLFPAAGKREEAAFDAQAVGALPHHAGVGPVAAEQLERPEQGRLAGARFARDHREPAGGRERGVADERDILYMQLVDHGRSFAKPGSNTNKCTISLVREKLLNA